LASKKVTLRWSGEGEVFRGGAPGRVEVPIDGSGEAGPSPMDALLLSLAGCMGIDVLMILEKSRVPVRSFEVEVEGTRPDDPPRRFLSLRLDYRIEGPGPEDQGRLERAVALSRDKYCSVFHTLRPDLDVDIRIHRL
jgi:putative redox protein